MAKYIDVDKVLQKLPDDLPYKESVKRVLIQAEEADVVEVVRCKDCQHYEADIIAGQIGYCNEHQMGMYEQNFCSYGEKRGSI